jgi:hypothetical protein
MNNRHLQNKLDSVINRVQKKLIEQKILIPVKIDGGIQIGNVSIINRDTFKDLYQNTELIYKGISLNKVAIKMANLLAISPMHSQLEIKELYRADQQFGQALEDYQIFRIRFRQLTESNNNNKADIMLARLCYSKDRANYYKNQALRLAI